MAYGRAHRTLRMISSCSCLLLVLDAVIHGAVWYHKSSVSEKVDARIQSSCSCCSVNSCVNPLVYGSYANS
ncbi:hypothetical protein TNCT_444491, partial [Trichonephila clavata]